MNSMFFHWIPSLWYSSCKTITMVTEQYTFCTVTELIYSHTHVSLQSQLCQTVHIKSGLFAFLHFAPTPPPPTPNPHTHVTWKQRSWTDLLKLEDVLVEVILQVFVGVVDTELFEAVASKVLKPKDVQHPDGVALKHANRRWPLFYFCAQKKKESQTHHILSPILNLGITLTHQPSSYAYPLMLPFSVFPLYTQSLAICLNTWTGHLFEQMNWLPQYLYEHMNWPSVWTNELATSVPVWTNELAVWMNWFNPSASFYLQGLVLQHPFIILLA